MFEPFNQINPINLIISSVLFVFVFIFFIVKLNEIRKKIQDNRTFLIKIIDGQINKINSEFVTMDTLKKLISENDFNDPNQPSNNENVVEDIKDDISYDNPSIPSVPIENDPDLEEEFEEDSSDEEDGIDIK